MRAGVRGMQCVRRVCCADASECVSGDTEAVEKALTRASRSKVLLEVCKLVNLKDAATAPALKPHFGACTLLRAHWHHALRADVASCTQMRL